MLRLSRTPLIAILRGVGPEEAEAIRRTGTARRPTYFFSPLT
jgi:hypothetical protein